MHGRGCRRRDQTVPASTHVICNYPGVSTSRFSRPRAKTRLFLVFLPFVAGASRLPFRQYAHTDVVVPFLAGHVVPGAALHRTRRSSFAHARVGCESDTGRRWVHDPLRHAAWGLHRTDQRRAQDGAHDKFTSRRVLLLRGPGVYGRWARQQSLERDTRDDRHTADLCAHDDSAGRGADAAAGVVHNAGSIRDHGRWYLL